MAQLLANKIGGDPSATKPPLAAKPVPKPRRRLTTGSPPLASPSEKAADNGKSSNKWNLDGKEENSKPVVEVATDPQIQSQVNSHLPRKLLIDILAPEKGGYRMRRIGTQTAGNSQQLANKKSSAKQAHPPSSISNGQKEARRLRVPLPHQQQQQRLGSGGPRNGNDGHGHWGGKAAPDPAHYKKADGSKPDPNSAEIICSLSNPFWPKPSENKMTTASRSLFNKDPTSADTEDSTEEEHRPRFSLDHLVPAELKEPEATSPPDQSVHAEFTLRRFPTRAQCQSTVFVHQRHMLYGFHHSAPSNAPMDCSVHRLSPSPRRSGVTLLEQLVKSHPIWFLPHLNRQAVAHLLRCQPPGVFIVRASSRVVPAGANPGPGPLMALSVRLPDELTKEEQLDHFLLEAVGPNQTAVRLEGSPNQFASLPLLLEHYCQPGEAIRELKCSLKLPDAISQAASIQMLQGLALLGQDFWTSSLCSSSSSASAYSAVCASSPDCGASISADSQQSPTHSSLRSGPLPQLPAAPPPPPMSTFLLAADSSARVHSRQQHFCQSPSPSTMAPTVVSESNSEFGPIAYGQIAQGCCCCAGCPAHQQMHFAPLRKSHSVQSSLLSAAAGDHQQSAGPGPHSSSNADGRLPWCSSPGSQSLRETRRWPPAKRNDAAGFLRTLFSPSPSRRRPSMEETTKTPLWEEEQPLANGGEIWNRRAIDSRGKTTQPSIFARLKGNFRRNSSSGLAKEDCQEASSSQMSAELLWARQAAFRRTNTDMSGCEMASALSRMRNQQHQIAQPHPPGSPLPQMARVLPQPRQRPAPMMNGRPVNRNQQQQQFSSAGPGPIDGPPPADIRRKQIGGSGQQQIISCWARPAITQQHCQKTSVDLRRREIQATDLPTNNARNNNFRLSYGSRAQAVVATVRPQPKMGTQPPAGNNYAQENAEYHQFQPSEYTQLSELTLRPPTGNIDLGAGRCSFGSKYGDDLSVAGTDFNEPWDSNAWENLLELAKFGDAKTEVPLLSEQLAKRQSCSSSDSTWRHSSSTEEEDELECLEEEDEDGGQRMKGGETASADEISVTEEAAQAYAMAVVLAGNGTLSNRKKLRTTEWRDGTENAPPNVNGEMPSNASLDTLILIEQAAKAASSSRGNLSSDRGRWTRSISSSSDISKAVADANEQRAVGWHMTQQNASNPLKKAGERNIKQANSSTDPGVTTNSMHKNTINRPSFDEGHRRSERRIQAMMEKSIEEGEEHLHWPKSPTKKPANNAPPTKDQHQKMANSSRSRTPAANNIALFNANASHSHNHQTTTHHQNYTQQPQLPTSSTAATAHSTSLDELSHHSRSGSICPSITPVLSPSRLRNVSQEHSGEEDPARVIQRHVETLSMDDQTIFGATLQRFVECTLLSREQDPYVVIRRVRQFLNGMKNYLMKNGEGDLHMVIERESARLHTDEFLNIDGILEAVLDKILLIRIKPQLYRLMILESTRNGELGKLSENLTFIRSLSSAELGFPEGTQMPDGPRMEQISKQLRKMQNHHSPLKKIQLLLRALTLAVPHLPLLSNSELRQQNAQQSNSSVLTMPSKSTSIQRQRTVSGSSSSGTAAAAALKHPPADELIRWLVYLLSRSSTINCEIEAWYMWELLPHQVLSTGDASYFLSILFSAVHVLKHPESMRRLKSISLPTSHPLPNIADFLGSQSTLHENEDSGLDLLLRIAIPNEQEGSIEYHTFPVLPKMNVAKLCRVIAHQFSVSNPEDYALFVLLDGLETVLSPTEFPHLVRDQIIQSGKPHLFAYKRLEARLAWPRQAAAMCAPVSNNASLPLPAMAQMAHGRTSR